MTTTSTVRTFTESALRQLVNDALTRATPAVINEPPTTPVNPNVDPSSRIRGSGELPINPDFTPRDKVEFRAGVQNLVRNLPDDDMPELFDAMKDAIDDQQQEKELGIEKTDDEETHLESLEVLKASVRRMVNELDLDDDDDDLEEGVRVRRGYNMTHDVGGATLDEIAKEMGFAAPIGAKAACDKAINKMRFLLKLSEDDREGMMDDISERYVQHLASSGELTEDDTHFLRSNPDLVMGLDGFREFTKNQLNRLMREAKRDGDDAEGVAFDDFIP